jgi:hypothetical protein
MIKGNLKIEARTVIPVVKSVVWLRDYDITSPQKNAI